MTLAQTNVFVDAQLCPNPFLAVEVHADGKASVCCPSRLKEQYRYIGNVLEAPDDNPLLALWNSDAARSLRRAMYEGRQHESCAPYCPQLVALRAGKTPPWYAHLLDAEVLAEIRRGADLLATPYRAVSVACDGSCNLACIMCRKERQPLPSATERAVSERVFRSILADIDRLRLLELTGNGDPFHNQRVQNFLDSLKGRALPGLTLRFITNGQMLTPTRLAAIENLRLKRLEFSVSIDAASPDLYESIRRGGRWTRVLEAMELLASRRRAGAVHRLGASFVVMRRNLEDMPAFVALARDWGLDFVEFQRMHGVLAPGENIFEEGQEEQLRRLEEILAAPAFKEPWINVSPLGRCKEGRAQGGNA